MSRHFLVCTLPDGSRAAYDARTKEQVIEPCTLDELLGTVVSLYGWRTSDIALNFTPRYQSTIKRYKLSKCDLAHNHGSDK